MRCIAEEDEDCEEEEAADLGPAELNPSTFERVGLSAMMQANPSGICSAQADAVRKVTIEYLLQQRVRIPLFQRRYCWCEDQWSLLYKDAVATSTKDNAVHSLGRLTCAIGDSDGGRVLILDGQQRNTSCTLLLAAIRDTILGRRSDVECTSLSSRIDEALFPDRAGFEVWVERKRSKSMAELVVDEGEPLHFAALVPTYSDRASYFTAILPPCLSAKAGGEWQRPMEAKAFFMEQAREESSAFLSLLAEAILKKFEWLFFPIDTSKGNSDGTENLQVIFERLAVREAVVIKPMMQNRSEAADMGAVDFIRNLLLSSFRDESKAIEVYKRYWLVIEQSVVVSQLERMFDTFLCEQHEEGAPLPAELLHVPVGGQLYPRFRRWLAAALISGAKDQELACNALDDATIVERQTEAIMQRLAVFASTFAEAQNPRKKLAALPSQAVPRKDTKLPTLSE